MAGIKEFEQVLASLHQSILFRDADLDSHTRIPGLFARFEELKTELGIEEGSEQFREIQTRVCGPVDSMYRAELQKEL